MAENIQIKLNKFFATLKLFHTVNNLQNGNEEMVIFFISGVVISQYDGHRDNGTMGRITQLP
jgi:hypothetical protein